MGLALLIIEDGDCFMKVGLNLLLWTPAAGRDHFVLLDQYKQWGFDGVEFPMFDPSCSPWKELAKRCDDLGLDRTACTIVNQETNPISDDAKIRQAGLDYLKRCIDSCAELGASILAGPLYSPCGGLVGRGRTQQEFDWCAEGMREVAAHAAGMDICLAMEPLNRFETYAFNTIEDSVAMCEAVGMTNFGILFDTFHANIEEKSIGEAIRCGGKHIIHIHISENDRSTPGRGHVPWGEVYAAIRSIGYDGWLTIEAFGKAMPEVAAATCIWRSMFDTEEQLAKDGLKLIHEWWAKAAAQSIKA